LQIIFSEIPDHFPVEFNYSWEKANKSPTKNMENIHEYLCPSCVCASSASNTLGRCENVFIGGAATAFPAFPTFPPHFLRSFVCFAFTHVSVVQWVVGWLGGWVAGGWVAVQWEVRLQLQLQLQPCRCFMRKVTNAANTTRSRFI